MAYEQTKKQKLRALIGELKTERASFISHWRDISDHLFPRRGRFVVSDANKGDRRNQKIIDSTATLAARTLRSGMMGGITSPARPWFRLTTPDPELAEYGPVKSWLHIVGQRMSTVFLRSNLYNALPLVYGDMSGFGTAAVHIEEDFDNVLQCYPFAIGSYAIANDAKGRVRVFYREFRMTVRQIVETFGDYNKSGSPNWDKFTPQVRTAWDRGNYETWIDVEHVIQPNNEYDAAKLESKHKRFSSCYFESGSSSWHNEDMYLKEEGYDYFPVLAPRWEVTAEDVYGTSCPGMEALGDIRQLQLGEKRAAQAIEKMINPPMTAPSALKNEKASILPGDITYVDTREGQNGFRPAHEINFRLEALEQKQIQIRQRISRCFYEDLFLMLANSDRRQITAREIEERHEEKLLALGPVLEQLNQDLLDPLIDLTFEYLNRQGYLPPPPEELQGVDLKVEYISIMAQAQKSLGLASLERFSGFVGQVAAFDPQILDKVDRDQLVDEYGEAVGIAPRIIVPDEQVQDIRAQRQQAMQAQQQAELMSQGARTAKDLSQTETSGDNALARLINDANAGNVAGVA